MVETGWPFLAEALSVADLARGLDVPVVMTRGGQLNMAGLAQQSSDLALEGTPNLHALTCGVYRQDWIERAVASFGPERILHASSAPVFDLGFELERLRRAEIERRRPPGRMGEAAARLFALEPAWRLRRPGRRADRRGRRHRPRDRAAAGGGGRAPRAQRRRRRARRGAGRSSTRRTCTPTCARQADVERLAAAPAELGGVDALVVNHGAIRGRPFLETTLEDWDWLHAVVLRGVFLVGG